ncbi:hypothetical protein KY312_01740 [Candidatus Woesearchaeota archaeon]|nr:hypothetical protein [Candidatus Woesearchaeota archaeon]
MKKGSSQIDWAISLGVFVIFLTIFFILVHPIFYPETTQTSVINNIVKKFTDINEPENVLWSVNKLPVYFDSPLNETRAIALEFPYDWATENTSFTDNREFLIDESKIFFYHQLNITEIWLVNSNFSYTQQPSNNIISCNSIKADTTNPDFELTIENSELRDIDYKGNTKAQNIDLSAGGSSSFTNLSFICKYSKGTHDSYIMANDSIIFNYFETSVTLEMDLADDTYFYYYDGSQHSIPYNDDSCTTKTSINIIDFYDSDGIAFVSDDMNATFCYKNQSGTHKLNISLRFANPYNIILHDHDYINATTYTNSKKILGLMQTVEGLSNEKLNTLNTSRKTNYNQLKQAWNIQQQDFDWEIRNKT